MKQGWGKTLGDGRRPNVLETFFNNVKKKFDDQAWSYAIYLLITILFLKVIQGSSLISQDFNAFLRYSLCCLLGAILLCLWVSQPHLENRLEKIDVFLRSHPKSIIMGCFLVYVVFFVALTLSRHFLFRSHHFDLSPMVQSMYNTLQGRWLEHTWEDGINRVRVLGGTWEIILVILSPLLWVWNSASVLLVIQSLAIGSSVIPVALFLREKAPRSGILLLAGCLLVIFFSPFHFVNLFDFHPYGMAIPGLLWTFYTMETNRWKLFYLAWIYVLLCRSDLAVVGLSMGLYLILFKKHWKHGLFVFVLSLAFFVVLKEFISPALGKVPTALYTFYHHAALGSNTWEIAKTLFLTPTKVFHIMLENPKILNFLSLVILTGGLCFLSPKFFFIITPLLVVWYVPYAELSSVYYHHHAAMDTIIVFSSLLASVSLINRPFFKINPRLKQWVPCYLLLTALGGIWGTPFHITVIQETKEYIARYFQTKNHLPSLHQALALIPDNARVNAQSDLSPHVALRPYIYLFPRFLENSDYVIVDWHPSSTKFPINQEELVTESLKLVKDRQQWQTLFFSDGVLVLKRRSTESGITTAEEASVEKIKVFLKMTFDKEFQI